MDDEANKKVILNFIRKQKLAVLATSSEAKPEAAVVEFSENGLELIFDTFSEFRKYKNLQSNQNVAVVIGWNEVTVQYEGMALKLEGEELKECQKIHVAKLPEAAKFVGMEGIKFFKIIPKWIRYTDVSKQPWEVFEVAF